MAPERLEPTADISPEEKAERIKTLRKEIKEAGFNPDHFSLVSPRPNQKYDSEYLTWQDRVNALIREYARLSNRILSESDIAA